MSRKIKTWRDPFDAGFSICRRKEIEIHPGVTVLVGCNGAGKTTTLHNIRDVLKKEKIPVFEYDNKTDGGGNSLYDSLQSGAIQFFATQVCSSEGENIGLNLGKIASKWKRFLKFGQTGDISEKMLKYLNEKGKNTEVTSNERWILLDAMDSGSSIDNVIEMKELFQLVLDDAKKYGVEVYIVISSNEYELVVGSDCFDVMEGKYVQFKSYAEYKKFILHSREKKDRRYKEDDA